MGVAFQGILFKDLVAYAASPDFDNKQTFFFGDTRDGGARDVIADSLTSIGGVGTVDASNGA